MTNATIKTVTTPYGAPGIEIYFPAKPGAEIIGTLKAASFRWHSVKKCWYNRDTEDARTAAAKIGATEDAETVAQAHAENAPAKAARKLAPLWERTRTDEIPEHCRTLDTKTICAEVRQHLRERFPEVKISIRKSSHKGIAAEIVASPFGREHIMKNIITGEPDKYGYFENSPELDAVLAYCEAYLQSYNYDNSDLMTDYFDVNFYGRFDLASAYEQTAQSEEVLADIADFEAKKSEAEKQEKEERMRRVAEEIEKRKAEEKEAERLNAIREAEAEEIRRGVIVEDLAESEQIALADLLELTRKCDTIEEAAKESAGRADAIISRKISFSSPDLLEKFSRQLLTDWDFLAGKGGSRTLDCSEEDFGKLTPKQSERVKWFSIDCIGVYDGENLAFVIDPQGYSYARYTFLPDRKTRYQSAEEYQEERRKEADAREPFYFPATVEAQIQAAELKRGEPITVFTIDPFTCACKEVRGNLEYIFSRGEKSGCIGYVPEGKIKAIFFTFDGDAVIYRGILPPVPDEIRYTKTDNPSMMMLNFAGEFCRDYLKAVIKHYATLGYTPAIDSFQR